MYDLDLYHEFVTGNNSAPMKKILIGIGVLDHTPFLNRGESITRNGEDIEVNDGTEVKTTKVADRLEEIYQAIFGKKDVYREQEKYMGVMRFTSETKSYIDGITAMLFPGADYS